MTRFIVAVDDITTEQRDALTTFLKGHFGYWHWIRDAWLLVSNQNKFTSAQLRQELLNRAPGATIWVQPITIPGDWAAYAPKDGLDWLTRNWTDDDN